MSTDHMSPAQLAYAGSRYIPRHLGQQRHQSINPFNASIVSSRHAGCRATKKIADVRVENGTCLARPPTSIVLAIIPLEGGMAWRRDTSPAPPTARDPTTRGSRCQGRPCDSRDLQRAQSGRWLAWWQNLNKQTQRSQHSSVLFRQNGGGSRH